MAQVGPKRRPLVLCHGGPGMSDNLEPLARLKRALAERLGDDLVAYTELKDPACDLIIVAAEEWAAGSRLRRRPVG
jgi:hypothetical protein